LGHLDLAADAAVVARELDAQAPAYRDDLEFPSTRAYPTLGLTLWKDAKPADWLDGPYQAAAVWAASHDIYQR
jgi:hypothetical protein